ncbi:hypothetical protein CQW23_05769 [Capsicum baccatum]|uniref:Uncharacterized protein n=1 Tax=Capsicum baccatum TaxID=33114 RepID=A0A2G2XIG0_CAPBA|nr:hypothetical protein CQW23_05769 [Capsicum baccatum]
MQFASPAARKHKKMEFLKNVEIWTLKKSFFKVKVGSECQETILNLGKQLKALASPGDAPLFDKEVILDAKRNTSSSVDGSVKQPEKSPLTNGRTNSRIEAVIGSQPIVPSKIKIFLDCGGSCCEKEVLVWFAGFGAEEDEWVNVRKRVRQRSLPCEASESVTVRPTDVILRFQERKDQTLYYDAHFLDAQRCRHDVRGITFLYVVYTPTNLYLKMQYCILCAIQSKVVRVCSRTDRRVRAPPQRFRRPREVLVWFAGFGAEENEWVNVRKHEGKDQALYYDKHFLDAQRRRHDVRGCRCRFLVRYDHDQSEQQPSAIHNQQEDAICRTPAHKCILSFKLRLPTPEIERAVYIKEILERKSSLKTLLLLLVLTGTSMIIGDVMSAVSGLKGRITGFNTVIRAINPVNIYLFFKKNSTNRWSALGGCVLCITGLVLFAIGSETSVSITYPASRCGVTVLQPTFGAVGRSGVMSIAESLDKLGPFCRNSADCVIVLVFWIPFGGRTQMMFHPETFPSQILLQLTEDADICYDRIKDIPCITCPNKPEESMFVMVCSKVIRCSYRASELFAYLPFLGSSQ